MSQNVLSVRVDWTLRELAEFLIDKNISGAPVVDEAHELVGVVSETDIVRNGSEDFGDMLRSNPHELYIHGWESRLASSDLTSFRVEEEREHFVRDIMSTTVISVNESATIQDVADTMTRSRVHRLLVTSKGKLVGVITAMDMVGLIKNVLKTMEHSARSARSPF